MNHRQIGRWGEALAAEYLLGRGYEVLHRNVQTPYGEIDLVAQREGTIIFIEVKARTGSGYGLPEDAITQKKRGHLLAAIQFYWQSCGTESPWQVDVIAILGQPDRPGEVQIEHFENALTA